MTERSYTHTTPVCVWGWQIVGAYTRLGYVRCNEHATIDWTGVCNRAEHPIDADMAKNDALTCETPGCGRPLIELARMWTPPDYPDACRSAKPPVPLWQIEACYRYPWPTPV